MFIYITTNKVNGKRYVGMCTRDDDSYLGSGTLLKSAIEKYGKENFTREILEVCDDLNILLEREAYWIKYFGAVDDPGFYNLIHGGLGGNSELLKSYWQSMSKEERQKVRNWKPYFLGLDQKGDKHISKNDDSWTEKVSAAVKKSWSSYSAHEKEERLAKARGNGFGGNDKSGANNPMYGRSAVKEKNLRWYNNGVTSIYVPEGTEPIGFVRGRGKIPRKKKE
jgi:group I intron endonuclease